MRTVILALLVLFEATGGQSQVSEQDFAITMERTACLGECPAYTVTIKADGSVQFVGEACVRVTGFRTKRVRRSAVQKLVLRLQKEDFWHWERPKLVCLDFSEVHITAVLNGQSNQVTEGCNSPGKILTLAKEIDNVAGTNAWIH
jgi:hypothetical protein